jgi:hypothetical protein
MIVESGVKQHKQPKYNFILMFVGKQSQPVESE